MRKTGSTKGQKAKADKLFSELIRSRGRCERCGTTHNLQCAHIISRRFLATRCDPQNAVCLCAGCHHYMTDHPADWGRFVEEYMGFNAYDALLLKSKVSGKGWDWQADIARLKEQLAA